MAKRHPGGGNGFSVCALGDLHKVLSRKRTRLDSVLVGEFESGKRDELVAHVGEGETEEENDQWR